MPDIIDNVKVGEYIKKLLKQHNMTQDDLADALSISKSAVSQNLRGKSTFDIQNLIQIAKIFEITLDDLLNLKTSDSDQVLSEYQKVVQKGLGAITSVPKENLRIAQPDLYGKVLIDYIIEARQKEMFLFIHDNKLPFVEDYYHRAKELYLNVIKFMLEEGLDDVLNYILKYTKLHGSFAIEDKKLELVIWALLDKPEMQKFMLKFLEYKPNIKPMWSFSQETPDPIPLSQKDFIDVIGKYHLKNVLVTYMTYKPKDEDLYPNMMTFKKYDFIEGMHLYIDYYYQTPLSWLRKVSLEVQKTYLEIIDTKDFDLISKFAQKGLYNDLTPIVKKTISLGLDEITSHLIANYHEVLNFKKIGESCIQTSNIRLLDNIKSFLVKDDMNYLLSYVKIEDIEMVLYLLKLGATFDEKYYNLETFKKINYLIEKEITKGESNSWYF